MRGAATQPIEVYCTHCRVSFPTGTRRCIHCGGPLSRERFGPRVGSGMQFEPEIVGEETVPDDELAPRRGPFSPLTLLWIVVLAGAYLARMCAE